MSELRSPSMSDFLEGLENSGWLKHIKAVLDASVFIAKVSLGPNPRCLPPHWLNIGLGAGPQRPVMSCRRTVSLRISSPRSSFRKKLEVDRIIEKKKNTRAFCKYTKYNKFIIKGPTRTGFALEIDF